METKLQILESGGNKGLVNKHQQKIDQLVYKLYGLTPEEIAVVEDKEN